VYNTGGKENGGVGRKKGYIFSSSGEFFIPLVSFVGQRTQSSPAFILQNHMTPHERQALRQDLVVV